MQITEGADLLPLLLLLASADRDEHVFANGKRFDIEREDARSHISFGYGIHFCPGYLLAKMQLQIVIEELTARADVRLAPDRSSMTSHTTCSDAMLRLPCGDERAQSISFPALALSFLFDGERHPGSSGIEHD